MAPMMPAASPPDILQNRFLQKKFVNGCGIPTTDFRLARNHRELVVAHKALGFPGVLKLQFSGPDGDGPWVVHDLRRPARALMSRAGVRPDVGELALGHSIKGIQRVYDSRPEYQPQVDQAIQSVADQIDRILNPLPPNVVAIR